MIKRRGFLGSLFAPLVPVSKTTPVTSHVQDIPGIGVITTIDASTNYVSWKKVSGVTKYLLNGKLHRDDGPAVIQTNGTEKWYQNGQLHRTDGPAYIDHDGSQYWYQNGKLHRDNGPAVICKDGTEKWYRHGYEHRIDGPAVIIPDHSTQWFQNGLRHRIDGPAAVYTDGSEYWYQYGKNIVSTVLLSSFLMDRKHTTLTIIIFRKNHGKNESPNLPQISLKSVNSLETIASSSVSLQSNLQRNLE